MSEYKLRNKRKEQYKHTIGVFKAILNNTRVLTNIRNTQMSEQK